MPNSLPGYSPTVTVLVAMVVMVVFFLLFGAFLLGWWLTRREASLSPYSGMPLRRASNLSYASADKVLRYMHRLNQFENRIFDLKKAALCRETGRIFPQAITWYDAIKVDWTFIKKRYPGAYVSWGSLTEEQKESLRAVHGSLALFQTAFSSPVPSPRLIEPIYAFEKPGPLYVDVKTGTLVGWQEVPDTELEVLIVQKPLKIITINIPTDE